MYGQAHHAGQRSNGLRSSETSTVVPAEVIGITISRNYNTPGGVRVPGLYWHCSKRPMKVRIGRFGDMYQRGDGWIARIRNDNLFACGKTVARYSLRNRPNARFLYVTGGGTVVGNQMQRRPTFFYPGLVHAKRVVLRGLKA